jgi:hypothetical protein
MLKLWTDFNFIKNEDLLLDNEMLLVYPFLNESIKNYHKLNTKFWNNNIFSEIETYLPSSYTFIDNISDCDFILLPFKLNISDSRFNHFYDLSIKENKKLLAFYNDDNDKDIELDNLFIFRTSFYRTKIKDNIKIFPPFFGPKVNDFELCSNNKTIGFCGAITSKERHNVLDFINNAYNLIDYKKNIIIRDGFFCGSLDKSVAVNEFNQNLLNNLYNVCVRGAGNFTYRFFETLSVGRIPIFIDTDTPLPFENIIDYKKHCVIVNYKQLPMVEDLIEEFENNNNLEEVQFSNYKLYNEFLSPKGFINKINDNI